MINDAYFIWGLALFVISVILFLIFREVVCWYWKLNKITMLLESIDIRLSKINEKLH